MKFCLISDVHVDITAWDPARLAKRSPDCNTIVVAGDIANDIWITSTWLRSLKEHWPNVIWVSGNHDFFNVGLHRTRIFNMQTESLYPYPTTVDEMHKHYEKYSAAHGIHYLNRGSVVIDGVRFVGATGWHDFVAGEPFAKGDQMAEWMDTHDARIMWHKNGADPWVVEEAAKLDMEYITKAVADSQEPVVVVTHHLPHRQLSFPRPHDITWTKLHGMFVNTLMENVRDPKIKYWCYGHTHYGSWKTIEGVDYVCNPVGYPMENRSWQYVELDV